MVNERIRELAEQAGFYILSDNKICIPTISEEITDCQIKFAELIVRECADYFGREGELEYNVTGNWISKTIKRNFGVK